MHKTGLFGCVGCRDTFGKDDPYCLLSVAGEEQRTRTITDGGSSPVWDEVFDFDLEVSRVPTIEIKCFDEDAGSADDEIGSVVLNLSQQVASDVWTWDDWVTIRNSKGKSAGSVQLLLVWSPTPRGGVEPLRRHFGVTVYSGRDFTSAVRAPAAAPAAYLCADGCVCAQVDMNVLVTVDGNMNTQVQTSTICGCGSAPGWGAPREKWRRLMQNLGRDAPFMAPAINVDGSNREENGDDDAESAAKPTIILAMIERAEVVSLRQALEGHHYNIVSMQTIDEVDQYLSSQQDMTLAALVVDVNLPVGPNALQLLDTSNLSSVTAAPLTDAALRAAAPEAKPSVWVPRRLDVVRGTQDPNANEEPLQVRWVRQLAAECGQLPLVIVLPSEEIVESSRREMLHQMHKQALLRETCLSLDPLAVWGGGFVTPAPGPGTVAGTGADRARADVRDPWQLPLTGDEINRFVKKLVTVHGEHHEHLWELATHYGLDPDREPELLWLAEIAVSSPLPRGWQQHNQMNDDGSTTEYFYNPVLDSTQWEHPFDRWYLAALARLRDSLTEPAVA